jgi:tetraacyldisaccharide 4'-kinase
MSARRERWTQLMEGGARGPRDRLALAGLRALSVAYGTALNLHLAGYRLGLARRTRLPALVISVGNLTVGGTGKTTATIAVAKWLAQQGKRAAVLSRGYRGRGECEALVVSEGVGPLRPVAEVGDEPYLMALALPGVYVLAGKDRRRTGRLAVEQFGIDAFVLDDGLQYQRLVKDIEIALVDALAPFGYHFLLPRGLLREPPDHLARADAVWLTHADLVRENDLASLRAKVQELAPRARVWEARHAPVGLRRLDRPGQAEPGALRGKRVLALSSVGNPAAFERSLEREGAVLVGRARFPDHHVYGQGDLQKLTAGEWASAEWVVTTEKDRVRLPPVSDRPVWALQVEFAAHREGRSLSEELSWLVEAEARG